MRKSSEALRRLDSQHHNAKGNILQRKININCKIAWRFQSSFFRFYETNAVTGASKRVKNGKTTDFSIVDSVSWASHWSAHFWLSISQSCIGICCRPRIQYQLCYSSQCLRNHYQMGLLNNSHQASYFVLPEGKVGNGVHRWHRQDQNLKDGWQTFVEIGLLRIGKMSF